MYGKHFASMYTGSMFGAGAIVFAVWGYVIGNTVESQVELNPKLLAAILGESEEGVTTAIATLCAPDKASRNKGTDGRRLVREGEFAYRVVNHANYRRVRDESDRREYNRAKKAEGRSKGVNTRVKRSTRVSTVSAKTEADTDTDTDTDTTQQQIPEAVPPVPAHVPNAPAPKPRATWLTPVARVWEHVNGPGTFAPRAGQWAKALKPIADTGQQPVDIARRVYHYLRSVDAKYWSPSAFASTYGQWEHPPRKPQTAAEREDEDADARAQAWAAAVDSQEPPS